MPHIWDKHPNSSIAKKSNSVLEATVDRETCPLNLAPTASTSVAMAIGDALATVWMEKNKVSTEEFAKNHPAGQLGKKLTLTISDLMVPINKIEPILIDATLEEIIINENDNLDNLSDQDEALISKSIDLIKSSQKASTSFLQRNFQIGYNKAARIMEALEQRGVVSEPNHSGKRTILIQ